MTQRNTIERKSDIKSLLKSPESSWSQIPEARTEQYNTSDVVIQKFEMLEGTNFNLLLVVSGDSFHFISSILYTHSHEKLKAILKEDIQIPK